MVRVLDSGASGPGLNPGQGHCVMYLGKTLHSCSASLQPGVIYCLGGQGACEGLEFHPWGVEILFMLQKTEISTGLRDHLACMQSYFT